MIIWHDVMATEKIKKGQLLTVEQRDNKWFAYPARLTGERTSCDTHACTDAEAGQEVELEPVPWIIKDGLQIWDWEKDPVLIYA